MLFILPVYLVLFAFLCTIDASVHLQAWVHNSNDYFAVNNIYYYVNWGINDIRVDGSTYSVPKGLSGAYHSIINTDVHIPDEATWSGRFRIRTLEKRDSSRNFKMGDHVFQLKRGDSCFNYHDGNGNQVRYVMSWYPDARRLNAYKQLEKQGKWCKVIQSLSCGGTRGCTDPWDNDRGWGRKLTNATDSESFSEYDRCNECLKAAREAFPEANL